MGDVAGVELGWAACAIVVSYGLGTVPGARIVARRHGVDLLTTGDRNPGAWNALEQLGWRRAWPAFAIDGLKGLLAASLGWVALGRVPDSGEAHLLTSWLPWACVAASMLGHALPLPAPGHGGRSVMTFAGGAIGLVPVVGVPLLALFAVGARLGRGARAAQTAIFAYPVAQALVGPLVQVGWTGLLMTLMGAIFLLRARRGSRDPEDARRTA